MDGALRKTCEFLKGSLFPHAVLLIRDPTHFVRTAVKAPLEETGNFAKQHAALFGNRHALLKDIQHSRMWQARLEACQHILVRMRGAGPSRSAGSVDHILRHLGYAAHRFESVSGPRRLYVCLMVAIAMLLADIAGDRRREAAVRKRAEACLEAMTPQHILEAGLSGDYAEVGIRLLRKFDLSGANRDPATSCQRLRLAR